MNAGENILNDIDTDVDILIENVNFFAISRFTLFKKINTRNNLCAFSVWDYIPYSPSRDAYALNDADANLSHENKKEQHEVEGAISPVKERTKQYSCFRHNVVFSLCVFDYRLINAIPAQQEGEVYRARRRGNYLRRYFCWWWWFWLLKYGKKILFLSCSYPVNGCRHVNRRMCSIIFISTLMCQKGLKKPQ